MSRFVTFGEIMLRLTPPDHEVLFQTNRLVATFGGAEANVAVSLANYGENVAYVTAAPANPVGDAMVREMRSFGVDTSFILRTGDRLGVYYTETGAAMRPSKVVYDRAGSSIAEVQPGDFDWDKILDGATWFHTTGITPSLAKGTAEVILEGVKACRKKGITVSCDLNYRKKLWKWGKSAREVMTEFTKYVDVTIANEEDCQKCLGIEIDVDVTSGKLDESKYKILAEKVMTAYPDMKYLAVSLRESVSADWNGWSAVLADSKGNFYTSKKYDIRDIVDRIGGGDSFGSGLIWGLNNLDGPQAALEFSVAASALKHTIYGDFNRVSREDVLTLMGGDASGRVQR
ncbi:sugar kinase [Aminivibrio sp.]